MLGNVHIHKEIASGQSRAKQQIKKKKNEKKPKPKRILWVFFSLINEHRFSGTVWTDLFLFLLFLSTF